MSQLRTHFSDFSKMKFKMARTRILSDPLDDNCQFRCVRLHAVNKMEQERSLHC
jgi:hypothetical protein